MSHWHRTEVEALLPVDADLAALPCLDFDIDFLADQDWSRTWRRHFGPMRFGRLVVMPHDATTPLAAPKWQCASIRGWAFGTGTHPSTAACLDWLARQRLHGQRVLDVRLRHGILAIAALRLGADTAVAVDHDPQARQATADNAARNGVAVTIESDVAAALGPFDVALANIVANTLCELADELSARADLLALSGILPGQAERVMSAFPKFRFSPPVVKDGWLLLCGRRA